MSDSIHDNVKLIDFIELDRKRISRDIHDSVVQNLTALIHAGIYILKLLILILQDQNSKLTIQLY